MPNPTKVNFFVLQFLHLNDLSKLFKAFDKGVLNGFAHGLGKVHELLGYERLIPKLNHAMPQKDIANFFHQVCRQRLREVNVKNFSAQCTCNFFYFHQQKILNSISLALL